MKRPLKLTLSLLLALSNLPPALALTAADVVSAIDKGKILDPRIRVNAQVRPDVVYISTYKNPKANDRDCKIEAVLLAKTVLDLAPEVPRVEVRFYNQNALSKYKHLNVSAGDVKAFASGSLTEDQLIASLQLKEAESTDVGQRLTSHLEESQYTRRKREISSRINGKKVEVSTGLDPTLDDLYIKAEALRLAEKAFEAVNGDVDEVVITFYDNSKEPTHKMVSVDRKKQKELSEALSQALKGLSLDAAASQGFDVKIYELKEGPLASERKDLLSRLKALQEAGVNFPRSIGEDFMAIENSLESDETALREKITKLSETLTKLEANLKSAKEPKVKVLTPASKPATTTGSTAAGAAALAPVLEGGNTEQIKSRVLADPQAYAAQMAEGLRRRSPTKNGEDHPNYPRILQFAIATLREKGRNQEADALDAKLKEIQSRNGRQ